MIKSVIFDLDETLFDRSQTLKSFLADQYDAFRSDLGQIDKKPWIESFMRLDNRGRLSKHELYPRLLAQFEGRTAAAGALIADYYARSVADAIEMEGMTALLDWLDTRGIKIGIVTNGETRLQSQTLQALGLVDRVPVILISEQEKCRKPEREIFERAAVRLKTTPSDCLFVGDDAGSDVLGASGAGMKTVWFNRDQNLWPANLKANPGHELHRLDELPALLG